MLNSRPIFIIIYAILMLMPSVFNDRRIVSRPVMSTYNQYGKASTLILQWKCYQPIYPNDLLKLTFPQPIHDPSILKVSYDLKTAHSLSIILSQQSLTYTGSNIYYLPANTFLQQQVWYQLDISIGTTLNIIYGLIQIQIVSSPFTPFISHSWNNGFQYYHLEQSAVPALNTLTLNINNSIGLSTLAADRYVTLLQLSSSITINEPVNITIDFVDFNLSAANLTVNTSISGAQRGFIFIGSCYTRCDYADTYHTCIQSTSCTTDTSTKMQLTLPYMIANQIYLIQSYIVNPPYVSNVWLQAYWRDNSAKTTALTFAPKLLQVLPITVQAQEIRLLWDIPYSMAIGEMGLGLFVNDPVVMHQSLSNFDIGFSVSDVTPVQGQYQVRITVGATSVQQISINHNLPSFKSTTKISCRYTFPQIICTNVDAFIKKNYRYYVRARGNFLTTDNIASFGDVAIIALKQPAALFVSLVRGLTVKTIVNSDYHDYGGLHNGASNFRIGQTIIVSHNDTMLPNSTIKSIQDFLYSSQSLVGIDASITPQQLQFFLKVSLAQMSLPSPSTFSQNYTMKLFTNPNIMNTSNLGLDFVAYSSLNSTWDVSASTCYVDTSITPTMQFYKCQKYNDHVYGKQIDNTFTKNTKYGVYNWVCGNGQAVVCNTSDCSSACQIFKGGFSSGAMVTGNAGVLSIRNVTFNKSYHSPIEAGPNNLDFVLAFYHAGQLVSASLLNGYTINKTRLSYMRADLLNYYHDGVLTNPGSRLPTLLKLSGYLTLTQYGFKQIRAIRVHIPSTLMISSFIQTINYNKYGCSTQNCTASAGGLTKVLDTWNSQNTIQISNLPSLTQNFQIVLPVVYPAPLQFLQVTVSFIQVDGTIGGVYRINGSSVFQNLVGSINYIALPWTPINPWLINLLQWVNQPANYTYKQSIDLPSLYQFSPLTTINMLTSVLPPNDASPSSTFASAYTPIFSNYTFPTVDSINKCADPFGYTYMNLYKIYVLWCPMQAGSVNQIKINYPMYQADYFGAGFPYQMVFSYAYSNTKGNMIGYRVQQSTSGTPQACITQKTTTYDKNSINPQENEYLTTFTPFNLYAFPRNKVLITITLPSQIPMTFISCRAQQPNQNIYFLCNPFSIVGNIYKIQLTYSGTTILPVYSITMQLRTVKSGTPTITTIGSFSYTVLLPFTDSGTSLPSFTGTSYTPYSSLIASCSNSFTYSSVSSSQYIYLSQPNLTGISSNYYSTLTFKAQFSNSRTAMFQTSTLLITFSQPILNPYSRCQLSPNSHYFISSTIDVTNKILTLVPQRTITDFTSTTSYLITCSKLITNGNNVTISMQWKDSSYALQTTFANIIGLHNGINSVTSSFVTTLVNKYYSSPGFLGEYELTLGVGTSGERISLWVDFGNSHVHETFVQAQYLVGGVWTQVLVLMKDGDVQSSVYLQFISGTSANIRIRIYGILQTKSPVSTLRFLLKKQSLASPTSLPTYWISTVIDTLPTDITSPPIQILSYSIASTPTTTLTITYRFPVTYSGVFYIKIDELFRMSSSDNYTCMFNNTASMGCWRVRPDLLYINNTISHNNVDIYSMKVSLLNYWGNEKYDLEQVRFSMFVLTGTRISILYSSHEHVQKQLLTSSLIPPQTLRWQIPQNQYNSVVQIVYIGYYGPPAQLATTLAQPFQQSFIYTSTMANNLTLFSILDMKAQLGTIYDSAYIGTYNTSLYGYRNLVFTQNSRYKYISVLPIYVSPNKCALKAEFNQYNIISGGVTIPIAINITQCRPMQPMTVSTQVNSIYITADTTQTIKSVDMRTDVMYIVLVHSTTNSTLGQSFNLQVNLTCPTSTIVQNSYLSIPPIKITVVDRALLIGNPQAKQPIINQLTQNSINLGLQCNTPATIYWGVGIYPTMLGINFQQIQTRLVQNNNGLEQYSTDIYSWSHQIYGLNYVNDFNIFKNVTIGNLIGGTNYVFKYYCVDQTGKASGGKITLFNTMPSSYSLMKITLSYSQILTYSQVNSIACSLSQTLVIPYNQTISSVHSNCINNTEIYYTNSTPFYDEYTPNNPTSANKYFYNYFFYIETNMVSTRNITTILSYKLGQNYIYQNGYVPYYGVMRADALQNMYQPIIYDIALTIRRNQFTITVTVGLENVYLIAAVMDGNFDPNTQSLPTHYLMKQGYFSSGTKFSQIFSIYGRKSISATFTNLTEGQKVSVFYFLTVDNSALNSRHSDVSYKDLVTNVKQYVDLWGVYYKVSFVMIAIAIFGML